MLGKVLFACFLKSGTLDYEVCIYKDHLFRLYNNKAIKEASAEDYKAARTLCYI